MAEYTAQLRDLVRSGYDVGLDDYPIFDEAYREGLNLKIINHYMRYEIGMETPTQFAFEMNNKMQEIMPYYNQLLKSELISIDPSLSFKRNTREDKNLSTSNTGKDTTGSEQGINSVSNSVTQDSQNSTKSSAEVGNTKTVIDGKTTGQDTPMILLNSEQVENGDYSTDVKLTDDNTETDNVVEKSETSNVSTDTNINTSSNSNSTNDSVTDTTNNGTQVQENVITQDGFEIPLSDLILKYRDTFINVDIEIIGELKELFMMVY